MSKPKYGWWGYVKDMCRRWPELAAAHESRVERREYEAVRAALADNPPERVQLLRRCLLGGPETLQRAAESEGVSFATGKEWQKEFILDVAAHWGLLD